MPAGQPHVANWRTLLSMLAACSAYLACMTSTESSRRFGLRRHAVLKAQFARPSDRKWSDPL